jgi:hypothetical protein
MGFLRKLFGGDKPKRSGKVDADGFFMYVQCDNCGKGVRLRINKSYDLNRTGTGFVWHKTIVDSRCFRPMPTVVHFDGRYQVTNAEIAGGHTISREEYEAPDGSEPTDNEASGG